MSGTATTGKGKVTVARDGTFTYTPSAASRHEASITGASSQAKTDTFTVNAVAARVNHGALPVRRTRVSGQFSADVADRVERVGVEDDHVGETLGLVDRAAALAAVTDYKDHFPPGAISLA